MGGCFPNRKAYSGALEQEKIINENEQFQRISGPAIKQSPHNCIGAITFLLDSGMASYATGVQVSKNLFITSAHTIYDKKQNALSTDFKYYLEADGIGKDYYRIDSWRYLPQFQKCPSLKKLQYDYALVKIKQDENLPMTYKKFPKILVTCEDCLKKDELKISIYGFPLNTMNNFQLLQEGGMRLFQYGSKFRNRVEEISHTNFLISYKINTNGGHSGSPIIMDEFIIGIHNGCKDNINVGRLMTIEMAKNIQKWNKQLGGDPITIIYHRQSCKNHVKPKVQEKLKEENKQRLIQNNQQQESCIQIKQQTIKQISDRLQSIPIERRQKIVSLTLKVTVILYKRRVQFYASQEVLLNQRRTQKQSYKEQKYIQSKAYNLVNQVYNYNDKGLKDTSIKKVIKNSQRVKILQQKLSQLIQIFKGITLFIQKIIKMQQDKYQSVQIKLQKWQRANNKGRNNNSIKGISIITKMQLEFYEDKNTIIKSMLFIRKEYPLIYQACINLLTKCKGIITIDGILNTNEDVIVYLQSVQSLNIKDGIKLITKWQRISYEGCNLSNMQDKISDSLKEFTNLRQFSFYFRFPLLFWISFQNLSNVLNEKNLSKISIVIDPFYQRYEQSNNWCQQWRKSKKSQVAVQYSQWNWN